MDKLYFLSLASGSSGNCYYLGTSDYGILIDVGISVNHTKRILKGNRIGIETIMAILITHDHADHIKSAGYWGETLNIPIYATETVHNGIHKSRYVKEILIRSKRIIEKEKTFTVKDFNITAFEVPHDSSDNVGYSIEYGNQTFVIVTDAGHITETVRNYVKKADNLVFEANYDDEMLRTGSYPEFLKQRISGNVGHLSNHDAADFLASNYTPKLKNIWLCHLSRDNNHPELAYKTVDTRLLKEGIRVGKDLSLTILKRMTPSKLYEMETASY
ncbi:MAG: MBL fold metallo-hydrolase [Tannerella sp.]|jgi:phosphoribosyl 1,2-cyclic phosphodiesterase|nr:MBL fold metallo-hydrolase [Tannerella sp.]